MDDELWRDVSVQPYQVSSLGNVRGYGGRQMKPYLEPHGYYSVKLRENGQYVKKYLHCLLAECFLPNPAKKPYVDHINRIKTDNRLENLRWCTQTENAVNTHRHDGEMYGIYWYESRQSYLVKLKLNATQHYVGWRKSLDEAKQIRDNAKAKLESTLTSTECIPN
jgi:hypothetical protein